MLCLCGCKQKLTGKQVKWKSDDCKNRFNTNARREGAKRISQLAEAAASSGPAEPVPGLLPGKGNGKRSFHFRYLDRTPELQKLLDLLKRTSPTTRQIQEHTGCACGAHTLVSELRANGYDIKAVYIGRTENGRNKIYRYVLAEKKESAA